MVGEGGHATRMTANFIHLPLLNVIVIIVTWMKTFTHVREASRLHLPTHISTMLLKDGKLVRTTRTHCEADLSIIVREPIFRVCYFHPYFAQRGLSLINIALFSSSTCSKFWRPSV